MDAKLKHLEFVQAVVARLAGNGFLLKGWCVTLIAGLFALAQVNSDWRLALLAYFPLVVFMGLDAYFLMMERAFRVLYDHVRLADKLSVDFKLTPAPELTGKGSWGRAVFSWVVAGFYLPLAAAILIVMGLIRGG